MLRGRKRARNRVRPSRGPMLKRVQTRSRVPTSSPVQMDAAGSLASIRKAAARKGNASSAARKRERKKKNSRSPRGAPRSGFGFLTEDAAHQRAERHELVQARRLAKKKSRAQLRGLRPVFGR